MSLGMMSRPSRIAKLLAICMAEGVSEERRVAAVWAVFGELSEEDTQLAIGESVASIRRIERRICQKLTNRLNPEARSPLPRMPEERRQLPLFDGAQP